MKPSVGRIVHYQSYGTPNGEYNSHARAAVITGVTPVTGSIAEGTPEEAQYVVALCILNPTGQFFNTDVKYSVEPLPGCWNWPPKV
jgi:hypothetical protein